jgi:hypothetical protein
MALLFIDGFDHYQTSDIPKKYSQSSVGTPATILPTSGRRGGGCLNLPTSAWVIKSITPSTNVIVGAAINLTIPTGQNNDYAIVLFGGGNTSAWLSVTNGFVNISNANNVIIGTSIPINTLNVGIWNYVEWKMQIADSIPADSCIVRVNGVEVLNLPAGTDTRAGTSVSTSIDRVELGSELKGYVDDFYICNTAGDSPTDFLGDSQIDTLLPNLDGTYNDGVPSTGTDSWSILNNVPPVYTEYVTLTDTGQKETLEFTSLSPITSQTIYGVQVDLDSAKSESGTKVISPLALSNSTLAESGNVATVTSYYFVTGIFATDPDTSTAWDESGINAAQFGIVIK